MKDRAAIRYVGYHEWMCGNSTGAAYGEGYLAGFRAGKQAQKRKQKRSYGNDEKREGRARRGD